MSEEISVPRFPILGFRIPNSVWRMGNLEYRTMRSGAAGAHMGGTWASRGPGVTGWDMGCRTSDCYVNSGVGHWVSWGGYLVA